MHFIPPPHDCSLCPRLHAFHRINQNTFPTYHNAPVPSFGSLEASRLIIGLAPGLHGANATGRPFTNDYAGDTLYAALLAHGLARGVYASHAADGFALLDTRITNAVRCVPPENKPINDEIIQCNHYLATELAAMPHLRTILVLGTIAHKATLRALSYKQNAFAFAHGATHTLTHHPITLLCSYHCSRYNTNTGTLTHAMFDTVIARFSAL
ncbi:MAG: uracil-DNA glycosylase [Alphaproteobacteria bacterium]|nr:MAG: uracil-DNA glycosylase [Alphaproteobacteria bacterium]